MIDSDLAFELENNVTITKTTGRRDPELGEAYRRIDTPYGYVWFFTGNLSTTDAPQVTDIEVTQPHQKAGHGEEMFLMVAKYLATTADPSVRKAFRLGGLGVGWDVSHGFWKHMAQKYHGRDLSDGYSGEWTLGTWGFSAKNLGMIPFLNRTDRHLKIQR